MNRLTLFAVFPLAIALLSTGLWGCAEQPASGPAADSRAEDDEHDLHAEQTLVPLKAAALEKMGLELAIAGPGDLELSVDLPGEVQVNADRMAHVGPRVGGVARQVHASLGDRVRKGDLLAVLESRELADAKTSYLAAAERKQLAEATFAREDRLWRRKVSSEQDYLDARTALAEAGIALRSTEQQLHALGLGDTELIKLRNEPDAEYTTYRITAPFDGEVIDRHITIGEPISALTPVFTIADLSTVWVDLSVYLKDLGRVTGGDRVTVRAAHNGVEEMATIKFVQPILGEQTRTALARISLSNFERRWKPGMFVTGEVICDQFPVDLLIPQTALIRMDDGDEVVFVETEGGFQARTVTLGHRSQVYAEVLSGLDAGDRYVAVGGFNLKAELGKAGFGDGHGH